MKPTRKNPLLKLLAPSLTTPAVVIILGSSAQAADIVWKNTGTDFNEGENWVDDVVPGTSDRAVFTGPSVSQPALSAPATIQGITFSDATAVGYELSGAAITLTSTGTGGTSAINTSTPTVGVNTISAPIVLGAAENGDMRFNIGSVNQAYELVLSGDISSTDNLTRLYYDADQAGARTYTISGNNTYTANTTELRWATFNVNSPTAFGNSRIVGSNNPRLSNTSGGPITIANEYTASSNFSFNYANNPDTWDLTIGGPMDLSNANRTIDVGSGRGKLVFNEVHVGIGRQHQKGGGGTLLLPNTIIGVGSDLAIGGVNYTNVPWRINAGTLEVGTTGALGDTLDLRAGLAASQPLTGDDKITATIVHATNNTTIGGIHDIELSGSYILSNGANNRTLNITNWGSTTFSGDVSLTDTVGDGTQTLTVNVDFSAGPAVISGTLQNVAGGETSTNPMGFTKTGPGDLTLTGANTFAGTLTVNNGRLIGTDPAAFGSSGNTITVSTIGILQLSGGQEYTFDGPLTVANGAAVQLSLDDKISGSGAVTLNGALMIELPDTPPPDAASFQLFDKPVTHNPASFTVMTSESAPWTGSASSGVWAYDSGSGIYTYDQATRTVTFAADTDQDGLPDAWEYSYFPGDLTQLGRSDNPNFDFDGDGYSDLEEYAAGSNPTNPDSIPGDVDGDGLPDAWEMAWVGNLNDLSGLDDHDHDGDGVSDLDEYLGGSDPTNINSTPAAPSSLIHRWSFTTGPDQLKDSVGSSDATIVNPEAANGVTFENNAVTLAGGAKADSAAISLGTNLLGGKTTPVTIEVWATPNTAQSWAQVFNFGSSTTETFFMSWTRGTNLNQDRVEWRDLAGTTTTDTDNTGYSLGKQYHIVMTLTPAAFTQGEITSGTKVVWHRSAAGLNSPLWNERGMFYTPNTLADLNDVNNWLGLSVFNDNVASATYDEVRIWDGALTQQERTVSHAAGPDVIDLHTDSDNDGLPDAWEIAYFGNLDQGDVDSDLDGEINSLELANQSNPNNIDSHSLDIDGDGMDDSLEILYFGNLDQDADGDFDGDLANNKYELDHSSDPTDPGIWPDADGDGMNDGWEEYHFGNGDGIIEPEELAVTNGGDHDWDEDGEPDVLEFINGTDPKNPMSRGELPELFTMIGGDVRNGQFELQGPPPGTPSGTKRASWGLGGSADVTYWTHWASVSTANSNSGVEGGTGNQHAFMQGGNAVYNLTDFIAAEGTTYWFAFDKIGTTGVEVYLVYEDGTDVSPVSSSPLMTVTGAPVTTFGDGKVMGYTIPAGSPAIGKRIGVGFRSLGSWTAFDNVRFGPEARDEDEDGYDDTFEDWAWGNNNGVIEQYDLDAGPEGDPDNDGLTSLEEITGSKNTAYGNEPTRANVWDTDGDGLSDGHEILVLGTNPNSADTDGDGLSDGDEVNIYGTNPLLTDSDGDGYSDGLEVAYGSDPASPLSIPAFGDELIGLETRNGSFELANGTPLPGSGSPSKVPHWDTNANGDIDNWTLWSELATASNDSGVERGGNSANRHGAWHAYFQSGNAVYNLTDRTLQAGDLLRMTYSRTATGNLTAYFVMLDAEGAIVQIPGSSTHTVSALGNNYELLFQIPADSPAIGRPAGVGFRAPAGWPGLDQVVFTVKSQSPGGAASYGDWATHFELEAENAVFGFDADDDGFVNAVEFILGGSPASGSDNPKIYSLTADSDADEDTEKELILTIAVPAGTTAFATTENGPAVATYVNGADTFTITVRGSLDLQEFLETVKPVAPITAGLPPVPSKGGVQYEYRSFSLDGSNGLPGKGFMQVIVTHPEDEP